MWLETANWHLLTIIFKAIELILWAIRHIVDIGKTGPSLTKWVTIDLWIVST